MFKRKIIDEMTAWKNSTGKKKALVIKGPGRLGKPVLYVPLQRKITKTLYISILRTMIPSVLFLMAILLWIASHLISQH